MASRSLCTLRSQRHHWTAQHSVPAGLLRLAGQVHLLLRHFTRFQLCFMHPPRPSSSGARRMKFSEKGTARGGSGCGRMRKAGELSRQVDHVGRSAQVTGRAAVHSQHWISRRHLARLGASCMAQLSITALISALASELHGADVDASMHRRAASYSCLSRASIAEAAGRLRYAFGLAAARMAASVVRVVIRSGSVRASISAARPEATERSKAGMNSSVRVTSSPCAP